MRICLIILFLFSSSLIFAQSEIELTVETDSTILSGTLLLPEDNPTKAVALFFSGSGSTDRNGNSGAQYTNNSLKIVAEGLAENGIASLRCDKRGIGKSAFKGREEDVIFDDFVTDGQAWLNLLKSDDRFEKIYVIGHSQGSLVGAMVSGDSAVQKFISLAGISSSANEVIQTQLEAQSPLMALAATPKLDSLKAGFMVSVPEPSLNMIFRKSSQPFLISWFYFEPKDVFAKLGKPILAVIGTTDIQVPMSETELLHEAAIGSELYVVEGMNHVLKDAPADRMRNLEVYSDPEKPSSDDLVMRLAEFLNSK
ncbi:MAG: pimeloyl-ACP methyl ester carboxylesterase [Cryomorphaceae bacterium]|jgi:pimeloyl-ACP methyl ester carboxylesterase